MEFVKTPIGVRRSKSTMLARVLFALGFLWSLANLMTWLYGCGLMVAAGWWSLEQFLGALISILSTYGVLVWIRFGRIGFWPENLKDSFRLKFWRNAAVFHALFAGCLVAVSFTWTSTTELTPVFAPVHGLWCVAGALGWRWARDEQA